MTKSTYQPYIEDLEEFTSSHPSDDAHAHAHVMSGIKLTKMILEASERARTFHGTGPSYEMYKLTVSTAAALPELASDVIQTLVALISQAETERKEAFDRMDAMPEGRLDALRALANGVDAEQIRDAVFNGPDGYL